MFALKLFDVLIFSAFICTVMCSARLTIVHDGFHMIRLYQRLKTEEPPAELDPGFVSPQSRFEICKDITRNVFNDREYMKLVNKRKLYRTLSQPQHSHIFYQVFTRTLMHDRFQCPSHAYKYTNEYRQLQFTAIDFTHLRLVTPLRFPVTESVFVCVIKNIDGQVVPLYLSKEYNLSSGSYRAGRFLFSERVFSLTPNQYHVLLAEEPATVYTRFDHSVERLYLEIRKHHQSVFDKDSDPICKLVSPDPTTNQHDRLCKEIFAAAYFRNKVRFSMWQPRYNCFAREVSFKTEEARREATGRIYSENMISCVGRTKKSNKIISYYVSRAYRSHEVFVYNVDRSSEEDKVYLENLTIHVNVVEEPLGFEDVE